MDRAAVRQAAERVEAKVRESDVPADGYEYGSDLRTLARFAAAMVDRGDDMPVDEQWLESIGVKDNYIGMKEGWRLYLWPSSPPNLSYPQGRRDYEDGPDLAPCPTRGDVRRLLFALGIPLPGE